MSKAQQDFSADFIRNTRLLDDALRIDKSFDIVGRTISIANKKAKYYFVDGMIKDETMVKITQFLFGLTEDKVKDVGNAREFADKFIGYVETEVSGSLDTVITFVLSGALCVAVEGYEQMIIVDVRTYPVRSIGEPENDKVLRGAHDGFTETLIFNTALVRRRIRDPQFTAQYFRIGKVSKTDVALCYIENKTDKKRLKKVQNLLSNVNVNNLTMGQETLAEAIMRKQRFNPFPKVRYTERPDVAAACLNEGSLIIIVDNSPSAIIVPTGIFDFLQDANDFYFPPLIGTYLRFVRMIIFALTLLLTPVWLLLIQNEQLIPPWLDFIRIEEPCSVAPFAQLLIVEIIIDALKLASLNTPSALSSSLSIVGALVLGEFAVQSGWMSSEVVLYMAFVGITNFTQPSYELGYAFKLCRMLMIILVALFNLWGLIAGLLITVLLIAFNTTMTGSCYLYPLIPFDWNKLSGLLVRRKLSDKNN